jgi:hypothetical protein
MARGFGFGAGGGFIIVQEGFNNPSVNKVDGLARIPFIIEIHRHSPRMVYVVTQSDVCAEHFFTKLADGEAEAVLYILPVKHTRRKIHQITESQGG